MRDSAVQPKNNHCLANSARPGGCAPRAPAPQPRVARGRVVATRQSTSTSSPSPSSLPSVRRPRFTAETYHLFTNNCNNFTDECSKFLLGHGIPESIVGLPREVLATPLGAMLRPMVEQMQSSMYASVGTSDPFTAHAPELRRPGGALGLSAPSTTPSGSAKTEPAPSATHHFGPTSAAPAEVPSSDHLRKAAEPMINATLVDASPFLKLLRATSSALPEADAGLKLTADQDASLERAASALRLAGSASGAPEGSIEALALSAADAAVSWPTTYEAMALAMDRWPTRAAPAVLFLLRCAVVRPDAVAFFIHPRGPGHAALLHVLAQLEAGSLSALAQTAALGMFANAFATPSGVEAMRHDALSARVLPLALRALREGRLGPAPGAGGGGGGAGGGAAAPATAVGSGAAGHAGLELRRIAAALAHNLALSIPIRPSERPSFEADEARAAGAAVHDDSEDVLTDESVQLLCGLAEIPASDVADEETARKWLMALGRLLARARPDGPQLASSLGLGDTLRAIHKDSSRSADIRALAAEVAALIPAEE